MTVNFKKSVGKDFKKIDKSMQKKILNKIKTELSKNIGIDKKLTGFFDGLYSYRVNDFRVIYSIINKEEILILRIGHRKEVYL